MSFERSVVRRMEVDRHAWPTVVRNVSAEHDVVDEDRAAVLNRIRNPSEEGGNIRLIRPCGIGLTELL